MRSNSPASDATTTPAPASSISRSYVDIGRQHSDGMHPRSAKAERAHVDPDCEVGVWTYGAAGTTFRRPCATRPRPTRASIFGSSSRVRARPSGSCRSTGIPISIRPRASRGPPRRDRRGRNDGDSRSVGDDRYRLDVTGRAPRRAEATPRAGRRSDPTRGLAAEVRRILEITMLDRIFAVYETQAEALADPSSTRFRALPRPMRRRRPSCPRM